MNYITIIKKIKSNKILSQLSEKVITISKNVFSIFTRLWNFGTEQIISFPIRYKINLILLSVVILVVTILSVTFQQSQKRILTSKLRDICNLSINILSYDIKDKLLLGKEKDYAEITERVYSLKQQKIEGLDYAWVVDRNGNFIAQTGAPPSTGDEKSIPESLNNYIAQLEEIGTKETESHYEFYYPIFYTREVDQKTKRVLIGAAGIGFKKDIIINPIRDAQKIIITIALLVTIFSFLGIYFLSHKMARQIQQLSEAAKQIGQGNLDINISTKSGDELGQLAQEFHNMTMHLKEKLHMQKFVSQMTRQMIKKNIIFDNKQMVGEQQDVAVLFSDVRNFSAFSQRHEPQFVIELINIYLDLQAQIIEEHFGVVDKFMGDQIMGVYEGKNKNINMLRSAVAIQKAIRQINVKRQKTDEEVLTVGIGLNSGPAVVGNIGSKDRLDYTVVGDVVNLASRFCDVAKPGQIITSYELFNQINDSYSSIKLGSIFIKGRTQPVEICEVEYIREFIM